MSQLSVADRSPFVDSDAEGDADVPNLIEMPSNHPLCEGCKKWEERFKALQKEHTVSSHLD